jgi:hypothetical protein
MYLSVVANIPDCQRRKAMSTNTGDDTRSHTHGKTVELRSIAQAIDRFLVRLVTLAPFALLVLLVFEATRVYSNWIVAAVIIGAALIAAFE